MGKWNRVAPAEHVIQLLVGILQVTSIYCKIYPVIVFRFTIEHFNNLSWRSPDSLKRKYTIKFGQNWSNTLHLLPERSVLPGKSCFGQIFYCPWKPLNSRTQLVSIPNCTMVREMTGGGLPVSFVMLKCLQENSWP